MSGRNPFSFSLPQPRMAAALLWSLLPLFSLPLAFCRIFGTKVPFWGSVSGMGIAETGWISLGIVLLFPERLKRLWQENPFFRRFLLFASLFLLTGTIQQFLFHDAWHHWEIVLFYAASPFAAAALAPELKRLLPFLAAGECLLLLVSGFATDNFTGFCGNWNWTQAMILALFPAFFLLFPLRRPLFWSAAGILLFSLILQLFFPREFSRALLPVAAGAFLLIFAVQKRDCSVFPSLVFGGIALLFLLFLLFFRTLPDSRVQLWLGSLSLGMEHPLLGSGMGRYEFLVGETLPELYFSTPFAAPLHCHPHNELLWFFCGAGLPGLLYLASLFAAAMRGKCPSPVSLLSRWIAVTLFLWGMVDMPAAIPLGAWWFLTAAGLLPGLEEKEQLPPPRASSPLRTVLALAFFLWSLSHAVVNIRSGRELRLARIAIRLGNVEQAKQHYQRSITLRPGHEAFYEYACIALEREGNWKGGVLSLLRQMEDHGVPHYLHSDRLKALALANSGDLPQAREVLKGEIRRFPQSLINARLRMELATERERPAAREAYLRLCGKRGIPPELASRLTPEADDSSAPWEQ